jgi:hypothetical protein
LRATRGQPENFSYLATSSGSDAVRALLDGKAQLGISGYSEFRGAIESGTVRALAISSKRGRFGLPSLREGGVDTELANWRGVFAPAGINATQTARCPPWWSACQVAGVGRAGPAQRLAGHLQGRCRLPQLHRDRADHGPGRGAHAQAQGLATQHRAPIANMI